MIYVKNAKIFINKRLYQNRVFNSIFNAKSYLIKCLILFEKEATNAIKYFHENFKHLCEKMLQYEIIKNNIYINNITKIIKNKIKIFIKFYLSFQ